KRRSERSSRCAARAALDLNPATPLAPCASQPSHAIFHFILFLNFFIKSRSTLFKSSPACYNLIKQ
ncbi:hypothetical protein, partial [Pseudomonas plecoglossicida]|uniref:hypothetical protein n=1 Tax=Pseudomonas plecoglossicida TaxID=70775 RepID=UPI001C60DF7D